MSTDHPVPHSVRPEVSHELAILAALGSVVFVEVGAALGKGLFSEVPPTTAAWLRFAFAAAVLLGMRGGGVLMRLARHQPGHPTPRITRRALTAALAYAIALVGMNWTFYLAIETIPLGIAVTIEYLGPLTVAIVGSRGRLDLLWAALAGAGVALLGLRPVGLDPRGLFFIAVAAVCWAGYITLGARARRYWAGADLVTLACGLGTIVLAVPAVAGGGENLWTPAVLGLGLVVGVFSSVLPYRLDMVALGRVSPALFSILLSLAPAVAALAGWVLLGEELGVGDWVALLAVVIASVGATLSTAARQRRMHFATSPGGTTVDGRMAARVHDEPSPEDRPGDPAAGQPDRR